MLKVPKAEVAFALISDAVNAIATATRAGTLLRVQLRICRRQAAAFDVKGATATLHFSAFRRCPSCW